MRLRSVLALGALSILSCAALGVPGRAQQVCKDPRKIVGGEDADIKDYPWQVALKIDGVGVCGGTRVHQSWVLTAAHCFNRASDPRGIQARTNVASYKSVGVWVDAERVVIHEGFDRKSLANDLALVKLKSHPPGQWIPPAKPDLKLEPCELLEVSGWGYREEGSGTISDKLQRALVPYVDRDTCNAPDSYNGKVLPQMMCAGLHDGGVDACQGDSGGPLVLRSREHGVVLVGVVSWGVGCARKLKYGVYTRVTPYRDWISKVILSDGK